MSMLWYVMRSKPNKESLLWEQLSLQNIECYYPRLRVKPANPRARKLRAYFPGYLFVHVDLERINLAVTVTDGQQIHVPRQGEDDSPVEPPSGQPASGGKVNLNTADSAALETLPGIGPTLAQRIIDHRQANGPFERIEDLLQVSGIGQATFEGMKDLITTR